ncbi:MAG: DegV family protein [Chloroflexi bacterium]|nr:DegV family protein [Chloroflexota bacterium]
MPSPIAIVADSTCDLPKDLVEKHRIQVVPEYVLWGTESYRDGVDLTAEQFYDRMGKDKGLPKTSQPSPGDFLKAYQTIREKTNAESVLCLTLSAELSGTYNSAVQAGEQADFPVRVIDVRNATMPLGFMALTAAEGRDGGLSMDDIEKEVRASLSKANIFFTVSSLEFLHRGGRIGGAQRLIGDTLKIRPILTVIEGKVAAKESVRTQKRAVQRMAELIDELGQGGQFRRLGVIHGGILEDAEALQKQLREKYNPPTMILNLASPAVGTHVGPGCIGIAYQLA